MKRALAVLLGLCTLGFVGLSQIAIKGSWDATMCLVPSPSLSSTLKLTYTVAGFDITSTTTFGMTGLTGQTFAVKGAFGPFSIDGGMRFLTAAPWYSRAWVTTKFEFAGLELSLLVRHWLPGQWDTAWTSDPCFPQTPYAAGMQYTLTTTISPITARIRFLDCCGGIEFQDLLISLKGVELCCGIKYNADFTFKKTGFDQLVFSGINIPLCCGVSLDVSVTYGLDYKSVSVTPKFAGFAEACFTVWGDAVQTGRFTWEGIRIDGFRIRCTIADCNYLEYVHAFAPTSTKIPSAVRDKFICDADEYLELGFCGPGCCGGKYEVSLRILWKSAPAVPATLFGLRAFAGTVKIPIMANFTANLEFIMPAATGVCPATVAPKFCVGWTFTF